MKDLHVSIYGYGNVYSDGRIFCTKDLEITVKWTDEAGRGKLFSVMKKCIKKKRYNDKPTGEIIYTGWVATIYKDDLDNVKCFSWYDKWMIDSVPKFGVDMQGLWKNDKRLKNPTIDNVYTHGFPFELPEELLIGKQRDIDENYW